MCSGAGRPPASPRSLARAMSCRPSGDRTATSSPSPTRRRRPRRCSTLPCRRSTPPSEGWLPYQPDEALAPPMPRAGEGYNIHVTGLTHDERGYPAGDALVHDRLVRRLSRKVQVHTPEITLTEELETEDAEVIVVAYGATSRSARRAVMAARERGTKAGLLRLITLWPFPQGKVRELANRARRFVVAEMNLGQVSREVERHLRRPATWVTHGGGAMIPPETIRRSIMEPRK